MFIKIVPIHVMQVETLVIQEQQQQNYEALTKQNQFGNQQYNGKIWHGQHNQNNEYN